VQKKVDEYSMKIKAMLIVVFTFLACWLENAYCTPPDYYPSIKIPVMTDGYNVEKVYDNPKYTKSINYLLKVDYPAQTVIEFYNSRFKADRWVISNEKSYNEWQSFIDGTIKGDPKIRQRLSLWVKPDLKIEAFLALKYESQNNGWSDLNVICQIQPSIDYSKLEQLLEKLQKDKKDLYPRFMEQMDSIVKSNGEVDEDKFNHALISNKDLAPYLIEYKKMVDEITLTIKEILIKSK
jgi:hypothetical protein